MTSATSLLRLVVLYSSINTILSQVTSPVVSKENVSVNLTVTIPNTQQATEAGIITIRHEMKDAKEDVLYVYKGFTNPKLQLKYINRITTNLVAADRKVEMTLSNVAASDAGSFTCFVGTGNTVIGNCGQKLIVLRKPDPPAINVLSPPLEGQTLKLECQPNSLSLPADHGLASDIVWQDDQGQFVGIPGGDSRLNMDAQGHLELRGIQRTDKGRKFACTSADKTPGVSIEPLVSNRSPFYEVIPEFKPLVSDMVLTPPFENDAKIMKKVSEDLNYKCDISCLPACDVQWTYKSYTALGFEPVPNLEDAKILKKSVTRNDEGTYRCKSSNKHGEVHKDFELQVLYIEPPKVSINNELKDSGNVQENITATLQCTFDSNPAPTISWKSPTGAAVFHEVGPNPKIVLPERLYTSKYTFSPQCQDSGVYSCEANADSISVEGRANIIVMCKPRSADVDGLKKEYVWEIPQTLKFSFVILARPEPDVIRITSSVGGKPRIEELSKDLAITKESKYNGKDYLTKFTFESKRPLDQNDMDRIFIMTFQSSEFTTNLNFTIRPRGPPHAATNLTSVEARHDSVKLFWFPGFNGGEMQTFSVELRPFSPTTESSWRLALSGVKDLNLNNMWTEAVLTQLSASTDYEMRVISINRLGEARSNIIRIHTTAAPEESLSAGATAGIVIAVLIIIILVVVILYIFVFRKRWAQQKKTGDSSTSSSKMPARINTFLNSFKRTDPKPANGAAKSSDAPRRTPIYNPKRIFKKPKTNAKKGSEYPNRRQSDDESDDGNYVNDPDLAEDAEYINTDLRQPERDRDEDYANVSYSNNADGDRRPVLGKDKDEKGLVYVSVDFQGDKPGKKEKKKKKDGLRKKADCVRVEYTDIDFQKTEELREQMLRNSDDGDLERDPNIDDYGDEAAEDGDVKKPLNMPEAAVGTAV